ncbi:MAG TPA: zinc-ribbon domain containing protein, partial [Burkholderiaceae bacterium]
MKRKTKPNFKALSPQPGIAEVDRSQWSTASQRSYSNHTFYRDIEFTCKNCGAKEIFSALEQKRTFEVE